MSETTVDANEVLSRSFGKYESVTLDFSRDNGEFWFVASGKVEGERFQLDFPTLTKKEAIEIRDQINKVIQHDNSNDLSNLCNMAGITLMDLQGIYEDKVRMLTETLSVIQVYDERYVKRTEEKLKYVNKVIAIRKMIEVLNRPTIKNREGASILPPPPHPL